MVRCCGCCCDIYYNTVVIFQSLRVDVFLVVSSSQGLADNTVIAKVNGAVWDLDRPLEDDCSLQLLKFDDEEAQAVSPPRPWSDAVLIRDAQYVST